MTAPAPKYTVGQRVWVSDVNGRGADWPKEGRVVKVGRTLVHVQCGYYGSRLMAFRLSGSRNDNYGHQSIRSDADREADDRRKSARVVLRSAGVSLDFGCSLSLETIEALAAVVTGGQA